MGWVGSGGDGDGGCCGGGCCFVMEGCDGGGCDASGGVCVWWQWLLVVAAAVSGLRWRRLLSWWLVAVAAGSCDFEGGVACGMWQQWWCCGVVLWLVVIYGSCLVAGYGATRCVLLRWWEVVLGGGVDITKKQRNTANNTNNMSSGTHRHRLRGRRDATPYPTHPHLRASGYILKSNLNQFKLLA